MTAYFLRRLLLIIPTLIGVSIVAFTITRLVPGGPLQRDLMALQGAGGGGEGGSGGGGAASGTTTILVNDEQLEQLKKQYNLDKPGFVAYFLWLRDVVTLDLGKSFKTREPVIDRITQRLPISLTFGLSGFLFAYLVSVPLGIMKALRHGSTFDFVSSSIVFVGYSIPGWAMGALLLVFLASGRFADVFPLGDVRTGSYDDLPAVVKWMEEEEDVVDDFGLFEWDRMSTLSRFCDRTYHMLLPVFCYMLGSFAQLTVLTKNSLMENLGQDYVRTAFAKGISPARVILVHTLRNSLIPLATGLGHAIGVVMAASYLIEFVFNIDGIGLLGFNAIVEQDYPVVLGILVINTILILLGNIISDFLYAVIDPRIRFE